MPKILNLLGQRFSRLTVVLKREHNDKFGNVIWECRCDCGSVTYVRTGCLRNGNVRSCGCLNKDSITKHGMHLSSEYTVWCGIKDRCYKETHKSFKDYGAKGIVMCDRWKNSFEAFYEDMGPRPSLKHSIDRVDGTKGYDKENCRWATPKQQANNTKRNVYYEYDGEIKTLAEWCDELDLNYNTVFMRLQRGKPFEEAIYRKRSK